MLFSSTGLPSGSRRVRELLRKWYRVDVKLLHALSPRYAAERYSPVYEFRLPPYMSASVDMLWGTLHLVWGAPVLEREGVVRVLMLLRGVDDVKAFLEGQAVFAEMVKALAAVKLARARELASAVAEMFERAGDLAASFVSRVPGSMEVVEKVLAKYNVTYRDLLDYAASEEVARRLLARLKEVAGETGG